MKNKLLLFSICLIFMASACNDSDDSLPVLEQTPAFIEFDLNTRALTTAGVISRTESAPECAGPPATVTLTVENQFGVLNDDIEFTYTLGGDAVFGIDYSIPGATATGGTFTILNRDMEAAGSGNPLGVNGDFDIVISLLSDLTIDGMKTVVVTLTSARTVNTGVVLDPGRGGIASSREITLNIADADFPIDLPGAYTFVVDDGFGAGGTGAVNFTTAAGVDMFNLTDIGFGILGPAVPSTLELCGNTLITSVTTPVAVVAADIMADGSIVITTDVNCCGITDPADVRGYTVTLTPM